MLGPNLVDTIPFPQVVRSNGASGHSSSMAGEARTQFHQVSVTHTRVVTVIPSSETYICRYFNVLDTITTEIKTEGHF